MTLNFFQLLAFTSCRESDLFALTLSCSSTAHSNCADSYVGIYSGYSPQVVNNLLNTSSSVLIENLLSEL